MENKFITAYGEVTSITLAGRLDATNAPELMEELKGLVGQSVKKIVFYASELEYISSAGLRTIIFAKQRIGSEADIYLIAAQETVVDVIRMSGLDNFLYVQDEFTA